MSKKSKKQARKVSGPRPVAPEVTTGSDAPPITSAKTESEFRPDYSQTIKDLRRIGILAGSFFMVLIVLAFFLR
jgi:hypothetical protein